MPSYHLHTSNDDEEIYTGKQVELIVSEGASTETAHFITKEENYLLSPDIYRGPDSSPCQKAYQKHKQANLYVNFGPHKHRSKKQTTIQYDSPV